MLHNRSLIRAGLTFNLVRCWPHSSSRADTKRLDMLNIFDKTRPKPQAPLKPWAASSTVPSLGITPPDTKKQWLDGSVHPAWFSRLFQARLCPSLKCNDCPSRHQWVHQRWGALACIQTHRQSYIGWKSMQTTTSHDWLAFCDVACPLGSPE